MDKQNKVEIYNTVAELMEATAVFILTTAKNAVETRGRFTIALSGGNTPKQLYALLATAPFTEQMPWDRTFVFWGDERYVPVTDPQSNARMAIDALLGHVAIPNHNIYPIPTDTTPAEGAVAYEATIRKFFGSAQPHFDINLLGVGENGHTASLFPCTDILHEHHHIVKEVFVKELEMFRISMTADLINASRNILFLVAGKSKAEIVSQILSKDHRNQYPAEMIRPADGHLYWFLDSEAAMHLHGDVEHMNRFL